MDEDSNIGRVLDHRYELVSRLGAGGMGLIYRAQHVQTGAALAVKFLRPELCADRSFVRRLHREAKNLALARHDNIVEIIDVQPEAAEPYLVTELLSGEDLGVIVRREGRLPWPRVKVIMLQVCDGLQRAHECGLVHRDLKPANCVELEQGGRIKILDFGISRLFAAPTAEHERTTKIGEVFGTPGYMPLEQYLGDTIDARVDVYAAGAMMFKLLTGRLPFAGISPYDFATKVGHAEPPRMRDVAEEIDWPEAVEQMVRRALAWSREDRHSSMRELAAAIIACDGDEQTMREAPAAVRPARRWGSRPGLTRGLVSLAAAGAIAWLVFGRSDERPASEAAIGEATPAHLGMLVYEPPADASGEVIAPESSLGSVYERYEASEPPGLADVLQCEPTTRDATAPQDMEMVSAALAGVPAERRPPKLSITRANARMEDQPPTAAAEVRKARRRAAERALSQVSHRLGLNRYVSQVELSVTFSPQGEVQQVRVLGLEGTRHQSTAEAALQGLTLTPFPGERLTVSKFFEFD